jgi:hypothetical protein
MNKLQKYRYALAVMALSLASSPAFALKGLATAKTTLTTISTELYAVVGILAVVYLLWVGVQAKMEKKSWSDFFWAIAHIALVGSVLLLAPWAWSLFA